MAEHIGKFQEIGFSTEDERGVAEDSIDKSAKKIEADFYKQVEKTEDLSVVATVADIQKLRKVSSLFEGDVSMNLHVDTVGYLFSNIFGDVTTTEFEDGASEGLGVYEHDFEVDEDIKRQTLTTFVKDGDVKQLKVSNCVVDSFSLSVDQDDIISSDFSLVGTVAEDDSSEFSYDKEYDFIARDLEVKLASSKAGLSNSNGYCVKSLDIDIETGAEPNYCSDGNYEPSDVFQGALSISVDLNLDYTDTTFQDLYESDEPKYMRITITGDQDLVDEEGEDPKYPTLEIDLTKVFVEDWDRDSSQDEVITQDVTIRAAYNEDDGEMVTAKLINKTESYE